jgi:putative DNA primase/helicase
VLLRCFAGCRTSDVLHAIGLRFADLFDASAPRVHSQIVATYSYTDVHGEIIAEKVRYQPKAFRWRRPDATARSGWRWDSGGAALPLYRWPDLIEAREVLLTEGEKATDRLHAHGFTATCPPSGASTWHERWTDQLFDAGCERLIVLPDNDREGVTHARRVAAACCATMRVLVLTLPDLPAKGDVVDFFERGNTASDLRRLIDGAPDWTPDAEERERQNRKREQARKRKARQRQRAAQRHAVNVSAA